MSTYSEEHKKYLSKLKKNKIKVTIYRLLIIVTLIIVWQILADKKIINTFLFSSPKDVIVTFISLFNSNNLVSHILITTYEVLLSFIICTAIGLLVATVLWLNDTLANVLDPYLTILNSLPKVALGPLIIIWVGASTNSIIFMALLISIFVSIINIYNAFRSTNKSYITLLKSFGANKLKLLTKIIYPANYQAIVNTMKVNVSMCFVGVIMGELLVSKKGLGYLIMYGSQVFNINLVITSVIILGLLSYIIYILITKLEKKI